MRLTAVWELSADLSWPVAAAGTLWPSWWQWQWLSWQRQCWYNETNSSVRAECWSELASSSSRNSLTIMIHTDWVTRWVHLNLVARRQERVETNDQFRVSIEEFRHTVYHSHCVNTTHAHTHTDTGTETQTHRQTHSLSLPLCQYYTLTHRYTHTDTGTYTQTDTC